MSDFYIRKLETDMNTFTTDDGWELPVTSSVVWEVAEGMRIDRIFEVEAYGKKDFAIYTIEDSGFGMWLQTWDLM